MSNSLEDAIKRLVADAKADNRMLKVAPAALSLAHEHGVDARSVAQMIIDKGLRAHIDMEMALPEGLPDGVRGNPPDGDPHDRRSP